MGASGLEPDCITQQCRNQCTRIQESIKWPPKIPPWNSHNAETKFATLLHVLLLPYFMSPHIWDDCFPLSTVSQTTSFVYGVLTRSHVMTYLQFKVQAPPRPPGGEESIRDMSRWQPTVQLHETDPYLCHPMSRPFAFCCVGAGAGGQHVHPRCILRSSQCQPPLTWV